MVDTRIFDAFETLMKVDSHNWRAIGMHGVRMLPRWYGEETTLEVQARQALARTETELGAAAYAAMYIAPMVYDAGAFDSVDGALFSQGLSEMLRLSDNDPIFVNETLQRVFDICVGQVKLLAGPKDPGTLQRQAVQAALDVIMRENLTCHLTDVFKMRPRSLRQVVGELFKEEIEAGGRVSLSRSARRIETAIPAE